MNADSNPSDADAQDGDAAKPPEHVEASSDSQIGREHAVERQREVTQEQESAAKRGAWWDWGKIGSALFAYLAPLSAAATIVYAIIAAYQLSAMNGQIGILRRQIDDARMMQRAFITASDYKIARLEDDADHKPCWSFDPIISNTGETPTRDMHYTKEIVAVELPSPGEQGSANGMILAPIDPDILYKKASPWPGALLGPKQSLPDTTGFDRICFTQEDRGSMWAHERIYARGVIHYRDVFPGSPEHVTKYCFCIQAAENNGTYKPHPILCSHWNCADEECKRDEASYRDEVARDFAETGQTPQPPFEVFPQ